MQNAQKKVVIGDCGNCPHSNDAVTVCTLFGLRLPSLRTGRRIDEKTGRTIEHYFRPIPTECRLEDADAEQLPADQDTGTTRV